MMSIDALSNRRSARSNAPVCRLAPLAAAVALCFAGATHAATITVNNATASSVAGSCTIVDAVISLNTSAVAPGSNCIAGNGSNDTIDLSAFTSPTAIKFGQLAPTTHSALTLTKPATISGNLDSTGKPLVTIARTIEFANNYFRLIETNSDLTLSGITLSNGLSVPYAITTSKGTSIIGGLGGGIYATGKTSTVTLSNSIISGNKARYDNTHFAGGYGGGIYAVNAISLTNSTVSGNTADKGGGGIVSHAGSVTIVGSTISGNTASAYAGGIYATASGTTVSLTNTTISGNSAYTGGGGIDAYAVNMDFCTLSGNSVHTGQPGGGILITANSTANATLIFGNQPGTDVDGAGSGLTLSGDYNDIGTLGTNVTIAGGSGTHNQKCNPNFGALANNGGPTQTQALPAGSCAIDTGPVSAGALTTDQRGTGYPRKFQAATDIGAYEWNDRIFYDGFEP